VSAQLEDLIRNGHFGESGRLPSERELADQFGVGRGTMREAVRTLETLGIVVKTHGVGSFAVFPSPTSAVHELLKAGDVTALELFEVRYAIEPEAAALAAERRTQQDIREMRRILTNAKTRDVDPGDFVALDFSFHRRVAETSKNRLLLRLYEQIAPHHSNYSTKAIAFPGRVELARAGHLKILEAIEGEDSEAARRAAHTHLSDAEQALAAAAGHDTSYLRSRRSRRS
jgi:GntR family transcriptional repressor for pyruvate dehydrogenase complex